MTTAAAAAEGTETPAEPQSLAEMFPDEPGEELEAPEKPAEPTAEAAEDEEEAKLVEAEAAAETKPTSKLSVARAELAKKESAFRAEQKAHQEAAEQLKKDRAALDESKGGAEHLRKLARTDLAAFVAELKLDPETALEQVKAAWWSLQPEDKRPAEFKARAKVSTKVDEAAEKAEKVAREFEEYKKSVAQKEQEREQQAQLSAFFGATRTEFSKLALPHANALAAADPGELDTEVQKAFVALVDEGVDADKITPDKLGAAVEAALSKRYGWLRSVFAPKTETTQEPQAKKAPTTALSAKKVAGGGPTTTKAPQTSEDRFKAALKELGD